MSKIKTRKLNQLRPVTLEAFPTQAAGSVLIKQGNTHVLCTASIASEMPRWMAPKRGEEPTKGWVTAEYNMLPGSTNDRKRRGPDSRGTEIQRLIG
ncbi:MAG: ribonuclease PH, partial [Phycisphaeraceae bacterium]|nr:ribonuclease PH [Phycisphaeraceae bacterium]